MIQILIFEICLLILDILAQRFKASKIWQKESLILQYKKPQWLYEPQFTQHCKKYTYTTQLKIHSLYKFFSKHVPGWCHKKHLHCTISGRSRTTFSKHWEIKCLYFPVYLRNKIFVPQKQRKLLFGGRLNRFFKAARCLNLIKYFKVSPFNWNFWKFSYVSSFWYFHQ